MPFIPHTTEDIQSMLNTLNINDVQQLFDEIPPSLPTTQLPLIPHAISECALTRLMNERQPSALPGSCFIGAGAYEHHIPAAVWEITRRGEFYTAYTPYQAEASQGSLEVIYRYQSAMVELMAMEASNASLYDGSTALAEAILMAIRIKRGKAKRVIVPKNIHPAYRAVVKNITRHQDVVLTFVDYNLQQGQLLPQDLDANHFDDVAAVVIAQPNFFGGLEPVDELTDRAHQHGALVIACVNPLTMTLLKPPGQWGQQGADIVCGEGQLLGVPLALGGPYFGFLCTRMKYIRQMPGRIVGRTTDANGKEGFTLTLQAREQHIRRAKATSNICTNQGLVVVAATLFLTLHGAEGLRDIAIQSHTKANRLKGLLTDLKGVESLFHTPSLHEFGIRFNSHSAANILRQLSQQGIQGGYDLSKEYPELGNAILVCATETKTDDDLTHYQRTLKKLLQQDPQ